MAAWRVYRGYTQAALGQKVGVSAATIRLWESSRVMPHATHLASLCGALRCHLRDIYPFD